MGGTQRTHIHPFLDPKLAVESIGEVPRVPRAHLEVEFAQTIVRFSPPLYRVMEIDLQEAVSRFLNVPGKSGRQSVSISKCARFLNVPGAATVSVNF